MNGVYHRQHIRKSIEDSVIFMLPSLNFFVKLSVILDEIYNYIYKGTSQWSCTFFTLIYTNIKPIKETLCVPSIAR